MTTALHASEMISLQPKPWTDLPSNGGLYTFDGLTRAQVTANNHGLHKYPAKFVPQMAQWGIDYGCTSGHQTVLDPFCGSGTTNVQAAISGHRAIGIDISPLAILLTSAKTYLLEDENATLNLVDAIVDKAAKMTSECEGEHEIQDALGLHSSWSNWFRAEETTRLLALRQSISELAKHSDRLEGFLLACLSSVVKRSSFLSEDQIKVRFDKEKVPADPLVAFRTVARAAIPVQARVGAQIVAAGGDSIAITGTAAKLPLDAESVDRVVTSPPYINAIDYTMAHKYNLFALGLIAPLEFKEHCRQYIGMTERAVRAADLLERPEVLGQPHEGIVHTLWAEDNPLTRNRAYVTAQYFDGMSSSFAEMRRVLRPGGMVVLVVGTGNRICGHNVPTARLVEELAVDVGFAIELRFEHMLANRSSMRLNRSRTGGEVKTESVLVMRRP